MNQHYKKIVVDIVNPYGGFQGGIEDVIRSWTKNLDDAVFDLRVMHMTPGTGYLDGYEKAYFLKEGKDFVDASYCASGYNLYVSQLGAPDICIAATTPLTTLACDKVRSFNNLDYKLVSWVHSEISRYELTGNGGVRELLPADYHLAINSSIAEEIKAISPQAQIFTIGNPIIHDIPHPRSNENKHSKTLVYVGRLANEKRLDLILEAMVLAKSKWTLNVIGDGELRPNIEEWIHSLRLDNQVHLLGWKKNPLEYMTDATALVAASDYEGFMITGVEALAMGKMVISTPNQGAKDYLTEGINGYFFGFNDASRLAEILDGIAFGTLIIPSPDTCRNSVKRYQKTNYFITLKDILKQISKD